MPAIVCALFREECRRQYCKWYISKQKDCAIVVLADRFNEVTSSDGGGSLKVTGVGKSFPPK